jgi:hypothetical protein
VFKMGNRWRKGKGGRGERKGGEVSTQATWDQGGRESHHTPKEGFQVSKRESGTGEEFSKQRGITKGIVPCTSDNANLVHITPIVCMSC